MFKKLLANLPFNPSLIDQVVFYGRSLNKQALGRRLGFLFIGLALFVQLLVAFSPPHQITNPVAASNLKSTASKCTVGTDSNCSKLRQLVQKVSNLPSITATSALVGGLIVCGMAGVLLARSQLLARELEIIRRLYIARGGL